MALDHLILAVNDLEESLRFYTGVLGLSHEGQRPPFSVLRVTPELTLQLAPWGTAFALSRPEFEAAFGRIRDAGLPYGDAFDAVGNMQGPGEAEGSRGVCTSLYVFDPSRHLIELLHYEDRS